MYGPVNEELLKKAPPKRTTKGKAGKRGKPTTTSKATTVDTSVNKQEESVKRDGNFCSQCGVMKTDGTKDHQRLSK